MKRFLMKSKLTFLKKDFDFEYFRRLSRKKKSECHQQQQGDIFIACLSPEIFKIGVLFAKSFFKSLKIRLHTECPWHLVWKVTWTFQSIYFDLYKANHILFNNFVAKAWHFAILQNHGMKLKKYGFWRKTKSEFDTFSLLGHNLTIFDQIWFIFTKNIFVKCTFILTFEWCL